MFPTARRQAEDHVSFTRETAADERPWEGYFVEHSLDCFASQAPISTVGSQVRSTLNVGNGAQQQTLPLVMSLA